MTWHLRPPVQPSQQPEQGVPLVQNPFNCQCNHYRCCNSPKFLLFMSIINSNSRKTFHMCRNSSKLNMFNLKFYISEGIQDSWMSLQQYFSYPEAIQFFTTSYIPSPIEFFGAFNPNCQNLSNHYCSCLNDSLYCVIGINFASSKSNIPS